MNAPPTVTAFAIAALGCADPSATAIPPTTSGAIALANLDHQIAQLGGDELVLLRSRFVSDYDVLDAVIASADAHPAHLPRARARAAVHRFAEAIVELDAAEHAGEDAPQIAAQRASIAVATGDAARVLAQLEVDATRHPGYAPDSALGNAYAAVGRYRDADHAYTAALAALDTTSPFPYAWLLFVRGMMWSESAGDPARGEALYRQAIALVPAFVVANVHVAELSVARGDVAAAIARLEPLVASRDPEVLALLGRCYARRGDAPRAVRAITAARERFAELVSRHPLAFADHAAEFFLGPGSDPERAYQLARGNLSVRRTPRAVRLAIAAARATGRTDEISTLLHSPEYGDHSCR